MPRPALELRDFAGELLPPAGAGDGWGVSVAGGRARVGQALAAALGAQLGLSVTLEQAGSRVRGQAGPVRWECLVTAAATADGALRLQIERPRVGFLPLPEAVVASQLGRVVDRPGVRRPAPLTLEIDLPAALAAFGVRFRGRLREARPESGALELIFDDAPVDQ